MSVGSWRSRRPAARAGAACGRAVGPRGLRVSRLASGARPLLAIDCPAELRNNFAPLNVAFIDLMLEYLETVEGILPGHVPGWVTTGVTQPLQGHQRIGKIRI